MHLFASRAVLATALFLLAVPLRSAGQAFSPPMDYTQPGLTLREVTAHMRNSAAADDTGEGGERNEADVFEALWTQRVHHNDSSGSSMFRKYWDASSADIAAKTIGGCATGGPAFRGAWECIGPKSYPNTQRIGFIGCIWADPTDPAANTVLAGTPGGLFKTINGGGSWTCLTDAAAISHGTTSITSIAVHPTHNDTIYLSTASASILHTYNGGITWTVEAIPASTGTPVTTDDFRRGIGRVVFAPDGSRLYAIRGREIWCRSYPMGSWVEITPNIAPAAVYTYTELKFAPGSSASFMATANADNFLGGEAGRIMQGTFTGLGTNHSWVSITDGINAAGPVSALNLTAPYLYEVHCAYRDANRLLVQITVFDTFRKLAPAWEVDNFFHYNIATSTWSYVRGIHDLPSGCAGGCRGLTASTANPDVIYIQGGVPFITIDGGVTIDSIGSYGHPTHGDIRGIWIQKAAASDSAKDDVVFFATDGGVSRKPAGKNPLVWRVLTNENISQNGPMTLQFYNVATTEAGNLKFAGSHHSGQHGHEPELDTPWAALQRGDAWGSYFDRDSLTRGIGQNSADVKTMGETQPFGSRKMGRTVLDFSLVGLNQRPAVVFQTDADNNHYAGMSRVARRLTSNGSWSALPSGINTGLIISDTPVIIAMEFVPNAAGSSSPTGYAAYDIGNLYYRNPGIGVSDFTRKYYPAESAYPISGLTLDPASPQRVWIGRRNINAASVPKNRVTYSPDAGSNWYDVSIGLPAKLPVVALTFQQGSQNVYAATDVGIYRCDMSTFNPSTVNSDGVNTSVQWYCFSDGITGGPKFPNVVVTDLAINYCAGTLLASTHGRSLWETPLAPFGTINPGNTDIITGSVTWTGQKYLTGSLAIQPGATLTLSGGATVLHMPADAIILVKPGGTLIVDGATITNACKDCFWGGIEAEGTFAYPQTPSNSATVTIQNNALIEHARTGVANYRSSSAGPWAGGKLTLSDSRFRNNHVAVAFKEYNNADASRITRCSFDITDAYKGYAHSYPFESHISLSNSRGVVITGCTFDNTSTTYFTRGRGQGIASYDAAYRVQPYCASFSCPSPQRPQFKNLEFGIHATGDLFLPTGISIDKADFDKVTVGVKLLNGWAPAVTRSQFTLGNAYRQHTAECPQNIGIWTDHTTDFIIEENTFVSSASPAVKRLGVFVEHSGTSTKQIYKNSFTGMTFGCLVIGKNGYDGYAGPTAKAIPSGLQILCNNFISNDSAVSVYPPAHTGGAVGLHPSQENLITFEPAGNTFNAPNVMRYRPVGGFEPDYVYGGPSPLPPVITGFDLAPASGAATCPSRFDPLSGSGTSTTSDGSMGSAAFAAMRATRTRLSATLAAANDALAQKVDGPTNHLLSLLSSATANTAPAVRDSLLLYSPYVSETVLRTVAASSVLNLSMRMEVLMANPYPLGNSLFLQYLEGGMNPSLPQDAMQTLRNREGQPCARTANERVRAMISDSAAWCRLRLLSDIATRTDGAYYGLLPEFFDGEAGLRPKYFRGGLYFAAGDYDGWDAMLSAIAQTPGLNTSQSNELTAMQTVGNIMRNIRQNNRALSSLTEPERSALTGIANSTGRPNLAGASARAILFGADRYYLSRCPLEIAASYPPFALAAARYAPGSTPAPATENRIELFPNPASSAVTVSYDVPVHTGDVFLTLRDAAGRLVTHLAFAGDSGIETIAVQSWAPGLYTYEVRDSKRRITGGKLTVAR